MVMKGYFSFPKFQVWSHTIRYSLMSCQGNQMIVKYCKNFKKILEHFQSWLKTYPFLSDNKILKILWLIIDTLLIIIFFYSLFLGEMYICQIKSVHIWYTSQSYFPWLIKTVTTAFARVDKHPLSRPGVIYSTSQLDWVNKEKTFIERIINLTIMK